MTRSVARSKSAMDTEAAARRAAKMAALDEERRTVGSGPKVLRSFWISMDFWWDICKNRVLLKIEEVNIAGKSSVKVVVSIVEWKNIENKSRWIITGMVAKIEKQ